MTQEDKDLLLKDLCYRLPYNVKMRTNYIKADNITVELCGLDIDKNIVNICKFRGKSIIVCDNDIPLFIGMFKSRYLPYLFPLSSMTEEQKEEYCELQDKFLASSQFAVTDSHELCDWLNAHHFDYRGLISKGLALDATGLNIY